MTPQPRDSIITVDKVTIKALLPYAIKIDRDLIYELMEFNGNDCNKCKIKEVKHLVVDSSDLDVLNHKTFKEGPRTINGRHDILSLSPNFSKSQLFHIENQTIDLTDKNGLKNSKVPGKTRKNNGIYSEFYVKLQRDSKGQEYGLFYSKTTINITRELRKICIETKAYVPDETIEGQQIASNNFFHPKALNISMEALNRLQKDQIEEFINIIGNKLLRVIEDLGLKFNLPTSTTPKVHINKRDYQVVEPTNTTLSLRNDLIEFSFQDLEINENFDSSNSYDDFMNCREVIDQNFIRSRYEHYKDAHCIKGNLKKSKKDSDKLKLYTKTTKLLRLEIMTSKKHIDKIVLSNKTKFKDFISPTGKSHAFYINQNGQQAYDLIDLILEEYLSDKVQKSYKQILVKLGAPNHSKTKSPLTTDEQDSYIKLIKAVLSIDKEDKKIRASDFLDIIYQSKRILFQDNFKNLFPLFTRIGMLEKQKGRGTPYTLNSDFEKPLDKLYIDEILPLSA